MRKTSPERNTPTCHAVDTQINTREDNDIVMSHEASLVAFQGLRAKEQNADAE